MCLSDIFALFWTRNNVLLDFESDDESTCKVLDQEYSNILEKSLPDNQSTNLNIR